MKIDRLEQLYRSLKTNDETYFIFPFKKNNVTFEILFDIFKTPFELHFLQKDSNFSFYITVEKGFYINEMLNKKIYSALCKVLNLQYDPNNKFSSKAFFNEFNNSIPEYYFREKKEKELLKYYESNIEERDKLYFDCFIEWSKTNSSKKVSEKNLEKTRILYPELYEKCVRENISIRYKAILDNY